MAWENILDPNQDNNGILFYSDTGNIPDTRYNVREEYYSPANRRQDNGWDDFRKFLMKDIPKERKTIGGPLVDAAKNYYEEGGPFEGSLWSNNNNRISITPNEQGVYKIPFYEDIPGFKEHGYDEKVPDDILAENLRGKGYTYGDMYAIWNKQTRDELNRQGYNTGKLTTDEQRRAMGLPINKSGNVTGAGPVFDDMLGEGMHTLFSPVGEAVKTVTGLGTYIPYYGTWYKPAEKYNEVVGDLTNKAFSTLMPTNYFDLGSVGYEGESALKLPWEPNSHNIQNPATWDLIGTFGIAPVTKALGATSKAIRNADYTAARLGNQAARNYLLGKELMKDADTAFGRNDKYIERTPYNPEHMDNMDFTSFDYTDPIMSSGTPSGAGMSEAGLIFKLQRGKISQAELEELVSKKDAEWLMKNKETVLAGHGNTTKFNAIIKKAAENGKGKRGYNNAIEAATVAEKAMTKTGKLELLQKQYLPAIEESAKKTGINWSDLDNAGMMGGMDVDFKMTPVGFDSTTPFIERYYKNVLDVIKPGGFQDQLLKSGNLRKSPNGGWEGKFPDGQYHPVRRPEEYVKVRLAQSKGNDVELPIPNGTNNNYPMHGTAGVTGKGGRDIHYLTEPKEHVGRYGLWAAIMDGSEGAASAIAHYKGQGYSIPFFRTPKLETPALSWWKDSYGLSPLLNESPMYMNRVIRPIGVKDANKPWGFINEYNWGPLAPMPKSSWNTLDFEKGAGPFANNTEQDNKLDFINQIYLT